MRVLHIGKFYPPFAGGMEHFLADLLPALGQQGIDVAALVHDHRRAARSGKSISEPRPVTGSTVCIYRAPCYGRLLYAPISPQFPLWLSRAIREFEPDILHLHMPNTSAFWAMGIPSAKGIPWVIHWHSDVVASHIDRRLALAYRVYRPLEQRLLAASRAVIATSPPYLASSQALQSWQSKCRVIPMGLNPASIPEPSTGALSWAHQLWGHTALRVLTVGRLTYYKGHEVLIRALTETPDARLLIVGEGECRPRLAASIVEGALSDRAMLLGFQQQDKLHALLESCDVLCLPSLERTEAFGIVLLEAMRFRKPVIASNVPGSGMGWAVQQGGHGLLVKPGDTASLARALMQLASSPEQRDAFGASGAKALIETFHMERIAKSIGSLYQEISH